MKDHLTRQHFGAAVFALAALLLADTIVVPNATTATDPVSTDPNTYGIDILALNPKNE